MKSVLLKDIPENFMIEGFLCHKSGAILHEVGDVITLTHMELLRKCGITELLQFSLDEDPESYKTQLGIKDVSLCELSDLDISPLALFDDHASVVFEAGDILTASKINALRDAGIQVLHYRRDDAESGAGQVRHYARLCESDMAESLADAVVLEHPLDREKRLAEALAAQIVQAKSDAVLNLDSFSLDDIPFFDEPAKQLSQSTVKTAMAIPSNLVLRSAAPHDPLQVNFLLKGRSPDAMKEAAARYRSRVAETEILFNDIRQGRQIPFDRVVAIVRPIVQGYIADAFFCINCTMFRQPPANPAYLYTHAVNVCIVAAALGHRLDYDVSMIVELAAAALLHDIGHALTFKPLFAKKEMDPGEQQKYDEHAIVGVSMLKNFDRLPISTAFAVLQHHENLNGSGRILRCTADKMHQVSKIVAVADRFERQSSLYSPTAAIQGLLKAMKAGEIEPKFVKALLDAVSLYPVGVSVLVSGDLVCKVIGTTGAAANSPVVRTLFRFEADQIFEIEASAQRTLDLSLEKDIVIKREFLHSILRSKTTAGF